MHEHVSDKDRIAQVRKDLADEAVHLSDDEVLRIDDMLRQLASICVDEIIAVRKETGLKTEKDLEAFFLGNLDVLPTGERVVRQIPDLTCPECGLPVEAPLTVDRPKAATRYEDCLRKCTTCHIGWSNAISNPVMCFDRPTRNVPKQVRSHLNQVLAGALNEVNNANKALKFCFQTSEDAVTWTLFRGLQVEHGLHRFLNTFLPDFIFNHDAPLTMLLWGCPVPPHTKAGELLKSALITASDRLNESSRARTEPDVIIDAGKSGVIFIEVKLHSGNEVKSNAKRFNRYVSDSTFVDPHSATQSGYYELVRNWAIGLAVAGDRPFHLVNIGPDNIYEDKDVQNRWRDFLKGIGNHAQRKFHQKRWTEVIESLKQDGAGWIGDYLAERLTKGGKIPLSK